MALSNGKAFPPQPRGHRVFLALGTNLGDRQAHLIQALQYIKSRLSLESVSPFYETDPVGYTAQPLFLNAVCEGYTSLSPQDLLAFVKWVERHMGRTPTFRYGPRVIDVDLLFYDDLVLSSPGLEIPHPRLAERAFVLGPLEDIAPDFVHPGLKKTVRELALQVGRSGIRPAPRALPFALEGDVQQGHPEVPLGLSRVGISNLRRIVRLGTEDRVALFYATMDLFAHLRGDRAGVHMSRFSEILEEMGEEISLPPTPDLESLAERIALQIARRQEAASSEVRIRAQFLVRQETPLSSRRSDELYTFLGYAASDGVNVRRAAGVEVDGLTACPCAQDMVRSAALARLREAGYAPEEAERIVSLVPLATHNQRGRGTLILGCDPKIPAEHLVAVVEAAMSSETYELLKRPDEFFVVEKAHRRPRFVEDVVREMLRHVVEAFPDLPDDTFVLARQENLESIHQHNAFAEASALLGSLRRELAGGPPASGPSLEGWLRG